LRTIRYYTNPFVWLIFIITKFGFVSSTHQGKLSLLSQQVKYLNATKDPTEP
jgi:hypothetical protein